MASLTFLGQQIALFGTGVGTNGGLLNYGVKLRLYSGASVPSKSGSGFVNIADGNGYTPWTITSGDWTTGVVDSDYRIILADRTLTASGLIANIAGVYLVDASEAALAWWEQVPVTLQPGAILDLTALSISG